MAISLSEPAWVSTKRAILTVVTPRIRIGSRITLLCIVGALTLSPPSAWAQPEDAGPAAGPPTLSLADLGSGAAPTFYGLKDIQQLMVPVPRGLTPAALNVTVERPVSPRPGTITVTQDERTIARVGLPETDLQPIAIPLTGAKVVNDWLKVTLHTYLAPMDGYCLDPTNPLRLINGSISYSGTERPPAVVADFLPPVLRKLTLFLPKSPSPAESETAIQLAAAVTARYGRQFPEIFVTPLAAGQSQPQAPSLPMERQIVIKEGSDAGLSLQGAGPVPWLLVSGPSDELANQARLFSSTLSALAWGSKTLVEQSEADPQMPGGTVLLRDLGLSGLTAVGLVPQVSISLNQTRWGRSIHDVRVHLRGSYSPVPADLGGQFVVTVGGETIDTWRADEQGVIDRWVDVPDRLIRRSTTLAVLQNVASNTGRCGDFHTAGVGDRLFSLTISGDSTVQASPARPPVPGGLQSAPQAFMPRVRLGLGAKSFDDTLCAVALIVGLQRISVLPLHTVVTSVQDAIESPESAIVISAGEWNHPDIPLPVSLTSDGTITVSTAGSDGKPATLKLNPELRLASLQSLVEGNRSLLIATSNGAPGELAQMLGSLNSDRDRWAGLDGVALVSARGLSPVTVPATAGPLSAPEGSRSDGGWRLWVGGGVFAMVIVGILVLALRRKRNS